ncbi:T9SS type A sorting domain-containing protein [bacterium]|nr:T9SS type A sorting domain-containing protein [bacterium]MBU1984276.1 T9SS type A sorting domain-containing protein [bacterium]
MCLLSQYTLYPNFPNPFNSSTQIAYALPNVGHVTLSIFNLLGEEVTTLVDGAQSAGSHTVSFDGTGLASGVYLYRLQAEGFVQTRKMVMLK